MNRPPCAASSGFIVSASPSGRKSKKHSSTASSTPTSSHFAKIRRISALSAACPVGLFGWQRNTISTGG